MVYPVVKGASEVEQQDLEGGGKIRWLITHRDGAKNFSMRLITVKKGKATPDHSHEYEHEIFVLEGRGEAVLDGRTYPFKRDDFLFIPGGVKHIMEASEDLKLICIVPISAAIQILGP
ncbi:MAG: cupin domain-containing protein [Candidatus Thermoplasmatota archaeon]|jgi:quercetin dioxygenase-like cupin family protein|nr:cupin domain-containing protein [Candidatus Thermoplasmatota archaeon]MCL5789258.1 cupin domain-containing protein [Candidatus Thermoplasmatota archaeon]